MKVLLFIRRPEKLIPRTNPRGMVTEGLNGHCETYIARHSHRNYSSCQATRPEDTDCLIFSSSALITLTSRLRPLSYSYCCPTTSG